MWFCLLNLSISVCLITMKRIICCWVLYCGQLLFRAEKWGWCSNATLGGEHLLSPKALSLAGASHIVLFYSIFLWVSHENPPLLINEFVYFTCPLSNQSGSMSIGMVTGHHTDFNISFTEESWYGENFFKSLKAEILDRGNSLVMQVSEEVPVIHAESSSMLFKISL